VAVIRHVTSLVRRVSLVGRSRPCPSDSRANHTAIRFADLHHQGTNLMASVIQNNRRKIATRSRSNLIAMCCRISNTIADISSRDYVINQCLVFIFRKDRTFSDWLAGQGLTVCPAANGSTVAEPVPNSGERTAKPAAAQGRLPIAE
jgi:hypothetical protein